MRPCWAHLKRANELNIHWPLGPNDTDAVLASRLFPPSHREVPARPMPNFELIRKELMHNGVSKKLLWMEYVEDCKKCSQKPLMYSQFCYHIQQDEQKRRASMHIKRNPAEQIEVDWQETQRLLSIQKLVNQLKHMSLLESFPTVNMLMQRHFWI